MQEAYTSISSKNGQTDINNTITSAPLLVPNDNESKNSGSNREIKIDLFKRPYSASLAHVKSLQLNKLEVNTSAKLQSNASQKLKTISGTYYHQSPYKLPTYISVLSTNDTRPNTSTHQFRSYRKNASQQTLSREQLSDSMASITKPNPLSINQKDPCDYAIENVQTSIGYLPTSAKDYLTSSNENASKSTQLFSRNLSSTQLPVKELSIDERPLQSSKSGIRRLEFSDDIKQLSPQILAAKFKKIRIVTPKQALTIKKATWDPLLMQKTSYEQKKRPDYVWDALNRQIKEHEAEIFAKKQLKVDDKKIVTRRINVDYGGIHRVWSHRLLKVKSGEFNSPSSTSHHLIQPKHDNSRSLVERLKKFNEKLESFSQINASLPTARDSKLNENQTSNDSLAGRFPQSTRNDDYTQKKILRKVRFIMDKTLS